MPAEGQTTIDIPDRLRFNTDKMQTYMEKNVAGYSGKLSARKFGLGQSNPTFLLSTDTGQSYVMRSQPPGTLIKGAHRVDREARIIRALSNSGFPVPEVYALCTDHTQLGRMFYIMSFKQGRIFDNALKTAPVDKRRPCLLQVVRTLAQLHSLDIDELGLGDYGRRGGFYQRQIKTMARISTAQVAQAEGKVPAIPRLQELLHWFGSHLPEDRCSIVHGDYKPDNVVFAPEQDSIIAVLDWELSTLGHPLSDLANVCIAFYIPPTMEAIYPSLKAKELQGSTPTDRPTDRPTERELLQAYCDAAGIAYPIPQWNFFIAFSLFRLAVILQGVATRNARGNNSSQSALKPEMADMIMSTFSAIWWKLIRDGSPQEAEQASPQPSPGSKL